MITNKNYNVDLANLADKKLMYDFAKEMHFNIRGPGNKHNRDRTLIKLLKSQGLMMSASGVSETILFIFWSWRTVWKVGITITRKKARINSEIINEKLLL